MSVADAVWGLFTEMPPWLVVLAVSMLPLVELRGAIPVAILSYSVPWPEAVLLAFLGNLVPVLLILSLLGPLERRLREWPWWDRFFTRLFDRTVRRTSEKVKRYEALGLALFVAVPLPATGAYTGALAAYIFGLEFPRAFPALAMGLLIAAMAVTALVLSGTALWLLR